MFIKSLKLILVAFFIFSAPSFAHFGMIIPDKAMVLDVKDANVELLISFSHPFEQKGMDMEMPKEVGVVALGKKEDLKALLTQAKLFDHKAWKLNYKVSKPGVYSFYVVPQPYFEKAEDKYIQHITKVVIGAFGEDSDYDKEIGLKAEIIPISRPFGLYAGNLFEGLVKINGKAVPNCEVEVEFLNSKGQVQAPNDFMVCQKIKTDPNGVFRFVAPWSGWWGFSAISTDEARFNEKELEIGAVIWINFLPLPKAK